jgi:hypothetical protein
VRAHQLRVDRAVVGDELGVGAHRRGEPLARRAERARGEAAEPGGQPAERHGERLHPAAVGRVGELAGLDLRGLGDPLLHRPLQRVPGVVVALGGPALRDGEREPERVLARAVVAQRRRAPAGLAQRGRGGGVARLGGAAGEVGLGAPGGVEDLAHAVHVLLAAAVRGAGERQVRRAEPEALGHPGAHAGERLEGLGGRAHEHRRARRLPSPAVRDRPRDAVLALDALAAAHADARLADHDARTW